MSGCDHQSYWRGFGELLDAVENHFLFRRVCAGSENKRRTGVQTKARSDFLSFAGQTLCNFSVKLEITRCEESFLRHAERSETFSIHFRLHHCNA